MGMTDTAARLIRRFGQTATLVKPGQQPSNPYDNSAGTLPSEHDVIIAVTQFTVEERRDSFVADTDLRIFMMAGIEPLKADSLIIGGDTYGVESVGTLGPDGVVICYELRVSR